MGGLRDVSTNTLDVSSPEPSEGCQRPMAAAPTRSMAWGGRHYVAPQVSKSLTEDRARCFQRVALSTAPFFRDKRFCVKYVHPVRAMTLLQNARCSLRFAVVHRHRAAAQGSISTSRFTRPHRVLSRTFIGIDCPPWPVLYGTARILRHARLTRRHRPHAREP